jgi:asparagine synthase (glutamine-hydrolysing)
MIHLHLSDRYGTKWTRSPTAAVRGYAFWRGRLLEGESLADWVALPPTRADWAESLREANGSFQIVYREGDRLWAAVDRVRSMPLFYAVKDGSFFMSDDAYWVRDHASDSMMDDVAVAEFNSAHFVTGRDTLYPGVKQLQAGEALQLGSGPDGVQVDLLRYYRYVHHDLLDEDAATFAVRNAEMYRGVAQRLIESVNGRTIVIPLSGGYDSRSVALMLKAHGYDRVICYSYGQDAAPNAEAAISKEVAARLGYPWLFVPYTNDMWHQLFESDERRAFDRFADNLSSLSHIQDWPAVRELRLEGRLPDDSIIVPGHTGDFLKGGMTRPLQRWVRGGGAEDMLRAIQHEYYPNFDGAGPKGRNLWPRVAAKTLSAAGDPFDGSVDAVLDACYEWVWRERLAKYVVNSVRVYEFFGYEWRLPLWDSEMLALWERVPLTRDGTALYEAHVIGEGAGFGLKPTANPPRPLGGRLRDASRALRVEGFARRLKNRRDYHRNQLALFGVIPPDRFAEYASLYAPFHFYHARTRLAEIQNGE